MYSQLVKVPTASIDMFNWLSTKAPVVLTAAAVVMSPRNLETGLRRPLCGYKGLLALPQRMMMGWPQKLCKCQSRMLAPGQAFLRTLVKLNPVSGTAESVQIANYSTIERPSAYSAIP